MVEEALTLKALDEALEGVVGGDLKMALEKLGREAARDVALRPHLFTSRASARGASRAAGRSALLRAPSATNCNLIDCKNSFCCFFNKKS